VSIDDSEKTLTVSVNENSRTRLEAFINSLRERLVKIFTDRSNGQQSSVLVIEERFGISSHHRENPNGWFNYEDVISNVIAELADRVEWHSIKVFPWPLDRESNYYKFTFNITWEASESDPGAHSVFSTCPTPNDFPDLILVDAEGIQHPAHQLFLMARGGPKLQQLLLSLQLSTSERSAQIAELRIEVPKWIVEVFLLGIYQTPQAALDKLNQRQVDGLNRTVDSSGAAREIRELLESVKVFQPQWFLDLIISLMIVNRSYHWKIPDDLLTQLPKHFRSELVERLEQAAKWADHVTRVIHSEDVTHFPNGSGRLFTPSDTDSTFIELPRTAYSADFESLYPVIRDAYNL
jgi:hypothetical protein